MENTPTIEGFETPPLLGQSMTTRADFKRLHAQNLPGIIHGFEFPFTVEQIADEARFGAAWLTKAFRAAGALGPNAAVGKIVAIKDITKDVGGGAANKGLLEVVYTGLSEEDEHMPPKFFLKLPCKNIADRLQAALVDSAGPEIAFAYLVQSPKAPARASFPLRTPRMYFADINVESTNFIQVQECLPFSDGVGPGVFFPANEKFTDWQLPEGLVEAYYPLLVQGCAAICAWSVQQQLASESKVTPKPEDEGQLYKVMKEVFTSKAGMFETFRSSLVRAVVRPALFWVCRSAALFQFDFLRNAVPNLCPPEILDPQFFDRYLRELEEVLYYLPEILSFLADSPSSRSMYSHPNMNSDNAFFYRGEDGQEIKCGGLDFGSFGDVPLPIVISGMLSASENYYYIYNYKELIQQFVTHYNDIVCRSQAFRASRPEEVEEYLLSSDLVLRDCRLFETMKVAISTLIPLKVVTSGDVTYAQLRGCTNKQDLWNIGDFYTRCFTTMSINAPIRWNGLGIYNSFCQWTEAVAKTDPALLGGTHDDPRRAYRRSWVYARPLMFLNTMFIQTQVTLYRHGLLKAVWAAAAVGGLVVVVKSSKGTALGMAMAGGVSSLAARLSSTVPRLSGL